MNADLLILLAKKVKLPGQFRNGLLLSVLIFKGFDIEGRVKRAMHHSTDR